jgi:hypothetical protein
MSTAKLNVWITRHADACHIDDQEHYYVHITDCHGNPLVWCKKTYTFLEAKCGHLEVEIPPGCYTVFASHTPREAVAPPYQPFGNRLTHVQVVRANCGDHVCVTLFAPGMHYCGTWFKLALETQIEAIGNNHIDAKLARTAAEAVGAFIGKLQPDAYNVNVGKVLEAGPPRG